MGKIFFFLESLNMLLFAQIYSKVLKNLKKMMARISRNKEKNDKKNTRTSCELVKYFAK